jgi:hypothetical protein
LLNNNNSNSSALSNLNRTPRKNNRIAVKYEAVARSGFDVRVKGQSSLRVTPPLFRLPRRSGGRTGEG